MNLGNVPEGKKLGWDSCDFIGSATVLDQNGKKITGQVVSIEEIKFMKMVSQYGQLIFGWNGQYGQWAFKENGGAVTVPYAISPGGKLFVAGGYERRLLINDGELLFTPPGGFAIGKETPEDAAKRAALEEAGIYIDTMIEVGVGTCNRAFWLKNTTDNWPQTFFALPVDWKRLKMTDGKICLPAGNKTPETERLSKLIFIPVMEAIGSTDGIAVSAYAKVAAAFDRGILI